MADSVREESFGEPQSQSKPKSCAVPGCGMLGGRMFSIPKNAEMRETWKSCCKINRPLKKFMYVCSKHFQPSDFKMKDTSVRLKAGVIPSQNLPPADVPEYVPGKKRQCAILECKNTSKDGISLHNFPRKSASRDQWKTLCGLKRANRRTFICSEHFQDTNFKFSNGKRRLLEGAVPSRNLPLNSFNPLNRGDNMAESESSCSNGSVESASCSSVELGAALESIVEDNPNHDEVFSCSCDDTSGGTVSSVQHAINELENLTVQQPSIDAEDSNEPTTEALSFQVFEDVRSFLDSAVPSDEPHSSCLKNVSTQTDTVKTCDQGTQTDASCSSGNAGGTSSDCTCHKGNSNFNLMSLLKSDSHLISFTGINFQTLNCICGMVDLVQKELGTVKQGSLTMREKIVLSLCILWLNLSYTTVAVLFKIDRKTCSAIFQTTMALLAVTLRPLIYWPTREEVNMNMPECFKNFKKTRVVLDCTEIAVDRPKCLKCRIRMYSHYKGMQTMKFLIGCAPSGLITYLSEAYGGRASDKSIFEESELALQQMLEPIIDAIMVDKGFRIDDVCDQLLVELYRPPFVKDKRPLTAAEAEFNAKIAKARVHVERAIQRVKQFRILQNKFSHHLVPHINYIMTVIVALVNLGPPILADDKF